MFFFLSKLLDVLVSPLLWGIVLLAFAVPWRRSKPARRGARLFAGAGIAVLTIFSLGSVESALFVSLERSAVTSHRPSVTYDAVIVLGGAVQGGRNATAPGSYNDAVDRLVVAFEILQSGRAKQAILTGGGFGEAGVATDGETMRDQLVSWGIDERRLLVEPRAMNTRQNAVYTRTMVEQHGFRSLLLITSAFHMLRSRECFHAVGLQVDTLPTDFRAGRGLALMPRAMHLGNSELAIREMLGRVVYRTVGYAEPVPL